MATVYSGWVADDDYRVRLDYSVSYPNDTQARVTMTAYIDSNYGYVGGWTVYADLSCDGQSAQLTRSGMPSHALTSMGSRTFTVSRGSSARNISVSCRIYCPSASPYASGATASASVNISARVFYAPNPPTSCSASRASDAHLSLVWSNGAATTDRPRSAVLVERSVDGGAWSQVASLSASATSYADTSTSANHRYQYRVRSQGAGGYSAYVTSGYVYTTPSAPTGCAVARVSDASQKVTWQLGANASVSWVGVLVERQADSGGWVQVASLGPTAVNWTDGSTSAGHRYAYRVRSYCDVSNGVVSGYSTSGYVYTTPTAPTGVLASATGPTSVAVSAGSLPPWYDGLQVEHRAGESGAWGETATVSSLPATMASVAGLNYYRVRAYKGSLYGPWAESPGITTVSQPLAPTVTGLASVYGVGATASVSWAPNHPDGSAQVAAQVEVTMPDGSETTVEVSGSATSAALPDGATAAAGALSVRVRTKGAWAEGDGWGQWSSAAAATVYDWPQAAITNPAADGAVVDRLPLVVGWEASDVTGISSQRLDVVGPGGSVLHTVRLDGSARSYSLGAATFMLSNSTTYELRLAVMAGSSLSREFSRTFSTDWTEPAEPLADASIDDGLVATVTVWFGEEEGAPETVRVTVERVIPEGSWGFGGDLAHGESARDPLPPLNTDVTYRVTAHAESGVTSAVDVVARCDTWDWAYNFGGDAGTCVRMSDDQSWSASPKRSRELYHFADGGEGGGLPVAYEADVLDVAGSQSFTLLDDPATARALWSAARESSVGWVRDPFGGRQRASIDVSLSGGVDPGVVSVSVSTSELVFEEADVG